PAHFEVAGIDCAGVSSSGVELIRDLGVGRGRIGEALIAAVAGQVSRRNELPPVCRSDRRSCQPAAPVRSPAEPFDACPSLDLDASLNTPPLEDRRHSCELAFVTGIPNE